MNQESIFASLKYQFSEGIFECDTYEGKRKIKSIPKSIIQSQTSDHAIVEYNGKNPIYSLWYALYLSENGKSTDCVKEIKLIGKPSQDIIDELQIAFPESEVTIIDKEILDLEYEDLYTRHTLVLHFFGDLFLREKAYKSVVQIKNKRFPKQFIAVPRRLKFEKLAEILRKSRYIYNLYAYNCEGEDMNWQMKEIVKVLNPDTKMLPNDHKETCVLGDTYITSLNLYKGESLSFSLDIPFESEKFKPGRELYYDKPIKDSIYLEGLSRSTCGKKVSEEVMRFARLVGEADEVKQSTPYEIASEFRIWKLVELHDSNDPLCNEIIKIYQAAAQDGVFGAYNNLGVYYIQTEQYEYAKNCLNKAISEGDVNAVVNLCALAQAEGDLESFERIQRHVLFASSQAGIWNKAIDLWNAEEYEQAASCFYLLANQEDKFNIRDKGISQMAIKNLVKIYSNNRFNSCFKKDLLRVQKLLDKVDFEDNKELVAYCLSNNILTNAPENFSNDRKEVFKIIKELYDDSIFISNHTYNMACCYAAGIGCIQNYQKAIEICDKLLEKRNDERVRILRAYIYDENGDHQTFTTELQNMPDLSFRHRFNIALRHCADDLLGKGKMCMLELENVPGCDVCHEAFRYDNNLKICPRVLDLLGDIFKKENNNDLAKEYYERAAKYGRGSACFSLARLARDAGEIDMAKKYANMAMFFDCSNAFLLYSLISNSEIDRLRLYILLESRGGLEKDYESLIQFEIYKLLHSRIISQKSGDDLIWLKRSADNDRQDAIVEYAKILEEGGNGLLALEYLRKYTGNDEAVLAQISSLEEKLQQDERNNDYDWSHDEYASFDDYDDTDYDRDTWDALTDGEYGDYPGPGWDRDMFG